MFSFCSHGVKEARGRSNRAQMPISTTDGESEARDEPKRLAVRTQGRERKQYPALNAYSQEQAAWVLLSPKDPWC
jgi:hypothetical protein